MAGWDWSQILTAGGKQYVAKRTGSAFMEMSRDYPTDEQADADTLGRDIVRRFTAHIPHEGGRPPLGTLILESSKGVSTASGDGSDAEISRAISTDNGNTYTTYDPRPVGEQGVYDQRTVWHRNGRGRRPQTIIQFRINQPVKIAITGVVYGETT